MGQLRQSPGKGQDKELNVEEIQILGLCDSVVCAISYILRELMRLTIHVDQEYPIQKQFLPVEYLRDHAHLRTRTARAAAVMRLREQSMKSLYRYFEVR